MSQDSNWIIDADVRNFETEVIQRSLEIPVLVDFWATWCGPCKTLTPALEKRAREGEGRFLLAKIDLDQNPELAQAFRVQAVPTILALSGGKLVDGFQGALGDKELDAFLDKVAPANASAADIAMAAIDELVESGDYETAAQKLQELLIETPDDAALRKRLVEVLLDDGLHEEARAAFETLAETEQQDDAGRALAARLQFAETSGDLQELIETVEQDPESAQAHTALGKAYVGHQQYEEGLGHLLEAVRIGNQITEQSAARDEARATMLEVFEILGLEDPVANDYRFKLSLEIFA